MIKMKKLAPFCLSALLVAGLVLSGAQSAFATDYTFKVNSGLDSSDAKTGDGVCKDSLGLCSLRAAIQEASNCSGSHTIIVYPGMNYINLTGDLGELKVPANPKSTSITIKSIVSSFYPTGLSTPPTETVWVVANQDHPTRVLNIGSGATVTLKDIVIANGSSKIGGGIFNSGNLTLDGCWINENEASDYFSQETAGTTTYGGGGGIFNKGTLTLKSNNIISHNTALSGGGVGNFMESSVSSTSTVFENNSPQNCTGTTVCP